MKHHVMRISYKKKYGDKIAINKTVLYDERDYNSSTILQAIENGTINGLRGVIECYSPDFEQCFRSLKEDN